MDLKEIVQEKYGEAARHVTTGGSNGCCGGSALLDGSCDPITSNLYDDAQAGQPRNHKFCDSCRLLYRRRSG